MDKMKKIMIVDDEEDFRKMLNLMLKKLTQEELIDGIKRIAFDFYSIKSIFRRSFLNKELNPINSFSRFISNMSIRSFYYREKFNY